MKKIRYFLCAFSFCMIAKAQTSPAITNTLDTQLSNISQTTVTSGIIYERTLQMANLYNFNKSPTFNTANFDYFKQALLELNKASNGTKFITVDNLKGRIANTTNPSQVDLAILNTQFNILNFNIDVPANGGLLFDEATQKYVQIPNKAPFYLLDVTVIAPTKNTASGTSITYNLRNDLFFTNGTKTIRTLVANFGDGVNRTLINNQVLTNQSITINYTTSGVKTTSFTVTYSDNSSITTYGKIYFKYTTPTSNSLTTNTATTNCFASNDPLFKQEDFSLTADVPFTGYEIGDQPLYAKIDYRVYYSKNNTAKKLKKPIIILDGFDPGDKRKFEDCDCENDADCACRNLDANGNFDPLKHRSIVDIMTYLDSNQTQISLLRTLRESGFDVIIVNHPTTVITNPTQPTTTNQWGQTVPNNIVIDGGADYIERNAMAYVKLITQVNTIVAQNGSTDRIAIIGPSMGGQISRYALAYMEKNNIPHNVRLWVSIDSPHLGANIPLGDQALLNLVKENSDAAKDFYEKDLRSPAAQEQLIEFHKEKYVGNAPFAPFTPVYNYNVAEPSTLNAQTTSQGLPLNRGNSYFQQHYNNQNSNGVTGSGGWPVSNANFRKIALINGSLSGSREAVDIAGQPIVSFAGDNEKVLNLRGFQRVNIDLPWPFGSITFRIHIASLEANNMPSIGTNADVARFKHLFDNKTTQAFNNNSRGVMDNIPGGFFGAQNDIATPVLSTDPVPGSSLQYMENWSFSNFSITNIFKSISQYLGGSEWYLHEFNPIHSFIPTFSSIAYSSPNQNWNNPINTNLTCPANKQTPFDSYYGEAKNTQHTSFTYESVNWLLKELGDINHLPLPQAPHFPIQDNVLAGPSKICANNNTTYSISDVCKVPSPVIYTQAGVTINGWSVQGNLQIVATTPYSITVVGTSDDPNDAIITATFQNGQTIRIPVHVGTPNAENTTIDNSWDWVSINGGTFNMSVPAHPTATSYYWTAEADVSEFPMMCPIINAHHAVFTGGVNSGIISSITTTAPAATINWGNCLGTYVLTCYAVNDCGMTPYSIKVTTVGKPQNNPCTHKPYGIKIAPNPIESGRTNFVISKIRDASPCNFAKTEDGYLPKIYTSYEKSSATVSIYDFSGNQLYSNVFQEPEYIEVKELPKEDETNPEEIKKYEELNHYNIQGLNLNPGLYFIRVKDSDDDSEGVTVQVEVK